MMMHHAPSDRRSRGAHRCASYGTRDAAGLESGRLCELVPCEVDAGLGIRCVKLRVAVLPEEGVVSGPADVYKKVGVPRVRL